MTQKVVDFAEAVALVATLKAEQDRIVKDYAQCKQRHADLIGDLRHEIESLNKDYSVSQAELAQVKAERDALKAELGEAAMQWWNGLFWGKQAAIYNGKSGPEAALEMLREEIKKNPCIKPADAGE